MFKHRTLFVVGAGASHEYGLPVGPTLAARISDRLNINLRRNGEKSADSDIDLFANIDRRWSNERDKFLAAAHQIRDGVRFSASIDDFLDVHGKNSHVKRMGKSAIVKTILEYERATDLYVSQSNIYNRMRVSKLEGTWLIKLMRMLSRGLPHEEVEHIFQNVAFIVFNYDRCIEQFFFHALQMQYSLDRVKAGEIIRDLDIIHPYGAVGDLPMDVQGGIPFGSKGDEIDENYAVLSDSIRTYTEQIEDGDELEAIHSQVDRATNIVFLGFAYHDQNIALLKPSKKMKAKRIFGTAFGMSDSDVKVVTGQLTNFFDDVGRITAPNNMFISNEHKCSELFDYCGKSLPA